jgi:hypothetical protein
MKLKGSNAIGHESVDKPDTRLHKAELFMKYRVAQKNGNI